MDTLGHSWTLLDTLPFVISYLCSVKGGRYKGPVLPSVAKRLVPSKSVLATMDNTYNMVPATIKQLNLLITI